MKVTIEVTKRDAARLVYTWGDSKIGVFLSIDAIMAIKLARAIKKMEKETTRRSR